LERHLAEYNFRFLSEIDNIQLIAAGKGVKVRHHLVQKYGQGRWRKLKGFEPFLPTRQARLDDSVTIHLDSYSKGVIHAEAIAANRSVSALLREWIDERLDIPTLA
jgi:hypothetical protein